MTSQKIIELMQVPKHDVAWIKEAAQAAIELEMATIPAYLCAFWSIDEAGDAKNTVRDIFRDEMGHMGVMCNLLKGLGDSPKIVSVAPEYPGPLPGGVRPELTVFLSGMTRDYVHDVLMEIEKPEEPLALAEAEEEFPSIGKFYEAIALALVDENPTLSTAGQLSTAFGVKPLTTIAEAVAAIDRIRGQGEGTMSTAFFDGKPAHYYALGQIYHEKKIVESPPGKFSFSGAPVKYPKILPMDVVPAGGWKNRDPDGKGTLKKFSDAYRSVLENLERAWGAGGSASLNKAIGTMITEMPTPARTLMAIKREDCPGNYGPDFIL